jgi:replicative DNA helicase Mcm
MAIVEELSSKIDYQRIRIQESPEGMSGGEQPQIADVDITGDLCGKVFAGDHVIVNGVLKSYHRTIRGNISPNLDFYISANNIEIKEKQFSQIKLNDEEREQIEILSKEPDLFEKLVGSYAPSIYGHEEEKLAILLQMASGVPKINPDGSKSRGDVHILLCGDPAVSKSKLIKYATLIAPRGIYTSGESSTKAGLTAAAVKDETGEGRWQIEAGAFVLADMGMAIVDEFDKMGEIDRAAMHSVMEGQTVDLSKAGLTATLNARCSILAAANPKLSRFDMMASLQDQINLPPTILSRFDLIFPVMDVPELTTDTLISSHILKLHTIGEKRAQGMVVSPDEAVDVMPVLNPDFLRKYIGHSKTVIPQMSAEAREEIQSFYLRIRSQYDSTKAIPITARQLEALIRLAEASARLRLSNIVEKQDVERTIGIVMFCLNKIAYDTEKGVLDSDMISGVSKGRRDLLAVVDSLIEKYDPLAKTIRHQDLVRELLNAGLAKNDIDADKKITDLMHSTMLIELPHKMYKRF